MLFHSFSGWGGVPLVLSYATFSGFLGSVALVVLAVRRGLGYGLNRAVAGFGLCYAFWSFGFTVIYTTVGGLTPEFAFALGTLGMFGLPVASLGITFSFGHVSKPVQWGALGATATCAAVLVGWSWVGRRFFPELLAFSLDGTPVQPWEALLPWGLFAVNGAAFLVAFGGLLKARGALPSRRLRRQATLVGVQLVVGVGAYAGVSALEVVFHWPPVGMLALLYSLFLNFYLASKYRYLNFDLPELGHEIIDSLGEAVFLLDAQGNVRKANPAGTRLMRPGQEPAEGEFSHLFGDPALVRQAIATASAGGEPQRLPRVALGRSTASILLTPHHDHFQDPVGLVAIVEHSDALESSATRFGLSPREKEVASLLVQGLSVKEMADASFVSEATIKTHLLHLYRKSGAKNRIGFLQKVLGSR